MLLCLGYPFEISGIYTELSNLNKKIINACSVKCAMWFILPCFTDFNTFIQILNLSKLQQWEAKMTICDTCGTKPRIIPVLEILYIFEAKIKINCPTPPPFRSSQHRLTFLTSALDWRFSASCWQSCSPQPSWPTLSPSSEALQRAWPAATPKSCGLFTLSFLASWASFLRNLVSCYCLMHKFWLAVHNSESNF